MEQAKNDTINGDVDEALRRNVVSLVAHPSYLNRVLDIFKANKTPSLQLNPKSSTVPTPQVGTVLSARYISTPPVVLPPVALPPAPPTEDSGSEAPQVSTAAFPATDPQGNNDRAPSEYISTGVIPFRFHTYIYLPSKLIV